MVRQGSLELPVIDAAEGQRRQLADGEPADIQGLQRRWRLYGPVGAAEEEQLVDVNRQGRRILLDLPVPARDQLHRRAVEPGLLEDLPGDRGRGGASRTGPAAGQRPPGVRLLLHQQNALLVVEDGAAHVDLWGGVAGITAELDRELVGPAG